MLFGAAFVIREEEEIRFDLLYAAAGPRPRRVMFLLAAAAVVPLYTVSFPAVLDYVAFIDLYHDRIKAFHVKDAELNPDGRQGVYSGFQPWIKRAGRFRSLGDGQVDFGAIFSKLAEYDYDSWAVLEWECAIKHPEDGAAEGAPFIANHIIRVTEKAFDDFAAGGVNQQQVRRMLGIS